MAPKRKAATQAKASGKIKKTKVKEEVKEEEIEQPVKATDRFQSAVQALKAASGKKGKAKVDSCCHLSGCGDYEVYEDYDCMLNQTNIGSNNNKFYVIQLITSKKESYCWNRWGRVGELGQSKLSPFPNLAGAQKDFEKKFKDKTKNSWSERENFTAHPGKYTMIEVQHNDDDDDDDEGSGEATVKADTVDGTVQKVKPCSLDKPTQDLMSLIFSSDMFKEAMQTMNLDIKKMPLGKLSKAQIAKGFEALDELQAALDRKANKGVLSDLSSRFYTIVPHNFGRRTPPVIDTVEVLQAKKDMLLVLADIELAQTLQADKVKKEEEEEKVQEVPHPLDVDYGLLKCDLSLLDTKSEEYKVINTYVKNTGPSYSPLKILNVWSVNREKEEERLNAHKDIDNRRLLWHGTNIAVVVAILKSGLRIMPHSGGRVGKGIYFASENSKSAGYVGCTSKNLGIMFLNEVALGKEHHITMDDCSLKSPPKGYDSVVARGCTEPDPAKDRVLALDGRKITVPQGPPIKMEKYNCTSFSQSEYLVYKESQARLRYLLLLQF